LLVFTFTPRLFTGWTGRDGPRTLTQMDTISNTPSVHIGNTIALRGCFAAEVTRSCARGRAGRQASAANYQLSKVTAIKLFLSTILLIAALCLSLATAPAYAETVSVSLTELENALINARERPGSVKQLLLEKVQQEFDAANLNFRDGALLVEDELSDRTVEDGCTSTVIIRMRTIVKVAAESALSLQLESLNQPLTIQLVLSTVLDIDGSARQTFGFRLGGCRQVARDSFTFSADGPLSVRLTVTIDMNPVWIAEDTLRIRPVVELDGELTESAIRIDVDDTVLRRVLENYLEDEVEALLSPARLNTELDQLQDSVNQQLAESLNTVSQTDEAAGSLDIMLPAADDEQIVALYELLTPDARFPLTAGFIRENRFQLLAALLLDDRDAVNDLLQNAAACELSSVLQTDLAFPVAYSNRSGECLIEANYSVPGRLYTDAACINGFDYFPTPQLEYCKVILDSEQLGSADINPQQLGQWTLSPGTRFDVTALSVSGKQQPYVQRQSYKRVQTEAGICDLEMRVYTSQPDQSNRTPLIALHGGSWQSRSFGFLGVENMANGRPV